MMYSNFPIILAECFTNKSISIEAYQTLDDLITVIRMPSYSESIRQFGHWLILFCASFQPIHYIYSNACLTNWQNSERIDLSSDFSIVG